MKKRAKSKKKQKLRPDFVISIASAGGRASLPLRMSDGSLLFVRYEHPVEIQGGAYWAYCISKRVQRRVASMVTVTE